MKTLIKIIIHVIIIILLTFITQIGGVLWLISIFIKYYFKLKKRVSFITLYFLSNLILVPLIAPKFGRVHLPIFNSNITPRNLIYPLLFRNYVDPNLKQLLIQSSKELQTQNIAITYLDACFPFKDGFPLLPHLSHDDGKKIDISFIYNTIDGKSTNKKPSVSGYGVFVEPKNSKNTQAKKCLKKGYWLYDKAKYLSLGKINNLRFDENRTKKLLQVLLNKSKTEKIFIEPHLKYRLGLTNYNKIRYHGCKAVRHDDHIHLQIK